MWGGRGGGERVARVCHCVTRATKMRTSPWLQPPRCSHSIPDKTATHVMVMPVLAELDCPVLSVSVSVMLQSMGLTAPVVSMLKVPPGPAVTAGVGPVNVLVAAPGHCSAHA